MGEIVNGWLCVSAEKSEIAYAGNDGYDEDLGVYYSWDSTVNNASRLAKGDLIAIWNKKQLRTYCSIIGSRHALASPFNGGGK